MITVLIRNLAIVDLKDYPESIVKIISQMLNAPALSGRDAF